jgi:hypothetical protein
MSEALDTDKLTRHCMLTTFILAAAGGWRAGGWWLVAGGWWLVAVGCHRQCAGARLLIPAILAGLRVAALHMRIR